MVVVKKYLLTTFGVPSAGNVKDGGMHPLFISLSCIRNTYLRVKLIKLVCVCVFWPGILSLAGLFLPDWLTLRNLTKISLFFSKFLSWATCQSTLPLRKSRSLEISTVVPCLSRKGMRTKVKARGWSEADQIIGNLEDDFENTEALCAISYGWRK